MNIHIFSTFSTPHWKHVDIREHPVGITDLFRKRLMFPVHLYNNHWCLISVSFDDHKLILCNLLLSHGHDETKCMDAIQAYLMI